MKVLGVIPVVLVLACGASVALANDVPISIDHQTGVVTPTGLLQLAKGDTVTFTISNTNTNCYTYNATTKTAPLGAAAAVTNMVTLVDTYDGKVTSYRLVIAKQAGAVAACNLPLIDRTFPVETQGWNVSVTGAAVVFDTVEPVFFLEPGSSTNSAGATVDGYFVRHNENAEDDQTFGFSVLAHLYHSNKLRTKNGNVQYAPISFGFGVSDNSEAEFLLGTSLKFGEALYLTVGRSWRKTGRLPNELSVGGFTENANALQSLPTRTESGLFLAIGYRFGDIDISKFNEPYSKEPKVQ